MTRKITTRTIRRLRSAPRIVSLAGDLGEASPMKSIAGELQKIDIPGAPSANPRIINSVSMRPEAHSDLPTSHFTSVLTLRENKSAPRIRPPKLTHDKLMAKSTLRIQSNSRKTTTLDSNPRRIPNLNDLRKMTTSLTGETGLTIRPGQTIVTRLHQHRDSDGGMRCIINGDQAVRIAQLNEGGNLISDIDIPPQELPFTLEVERKASFLIATGLGGHPDVLNIIKSGPGAVTLTCSTDNTAATGFHPRNRVVVVSGGAQLCRGGVMFTNGERTDKMGWTTAAKVLKRANQVSLQTSSIIDTVLIIYRNSAVPSINTVGIDVVGEPHTITGEDVNATLWKVKSNDENGDLCSITTQMEETGCIHSIVAAKGTPESWIETIERCDWSTIVEEGELSNHGKATIRLDVPTTEQTGGE